MAVPPRAEQAPSLRESGAMMTGVATGGIGGILAASGPGLVGGMVLGWVVGFLTGMLMGMSSGETKGVMQGRIVR